MLVTNVARWQHDQGDYLSHNCKENSADGKGIMTTVTRRHYCPTGHVPVCLCCLGCNGLWSALHQRQLWNMVIHGSTFEKKMQKNAKMLLGKQRHMCSLQLKPLPANTITTIIMRTLHVRDVFFWWRRQLQQMTMMADLPLDVEDRTAWNKMERLHCHT